MEIGKGMSNSLRKTISAMGANTVSVRPAAVTSGGVVKGTAHTLTAEDAGAILGTCPSVRFAAPMVRAYGSQMVYGNRNWMPGRVVGTTPSYLLIRNWDDLFLGEPFTEDDVRRARRRYRLQGGSLQQLR